MSLDAMLNILKVPLYVLRCQPVFITMCPTEYARARTELETFLLKAYTSTTTLNRFTILGYLDE